MGSLPCSTLRSAVFVDTSAFYALADKTDGCHSRAVRFVQTNARRLVTSNLVAYETITLVRMRRGFGRP